MPRAPFVVVECDTPSGFGLGHLAWVPSASEVLAVGRKRSAVAWFRVDPFGAGILSEHPLPSIILDSTIHHLVVSSEGTMAALATQRGIHLLSTKDGNLVRYIRFSKDTFVKSCRWDPPGRRLLSAGWDCQASCWDAATGSLVAACPFPKSVEFAGFAKDGRSVLVVSGRSVVSWNPDNGARETVFKLPGKGGVVWDHLLSPDGSRLVSISDEGTLLTTETAGWTSHASRAVRSSCGFRMAMSADGSRLSLVSSSSKVWIWDVLEGRAVLKWGRDNAPSIESAAISADGRCVAVSAMGEVYALHFGAGVTPRLRPVVRPAPGWLQCVTMTGSDERMDQIGGCGALLNPLPIGCTTCRMPDLDAVAEPYKVGKGVNRPAELAVAANGNFLVSDRVRRVLEIAAPGQCRFVSTVHAKTGQPTPWHLAVPLHTQVTVSPPPSRERCPACREPWCFHIPTEAPEGLRWWSPTSEKDLFKAHQWGSHTASFKGWDGNRPAIFDRELHFSIRLEQLFKRLGFRGLTRLAYCTESPSTDDTAWVNAMVKRIAALSSEPASDADADADAAELKVWFDAYVKSIGKAQLKTVDWGAIQSRIGFGLPLTYREFAERVGRKSYGDPEEEGLRLTIKRAESLDGEAFRNLEAGDDQPDGAVVFAEYNNGDALCFSRPSGSKESAVWRYDHETDAFEPVAKSFAECIRRFATKSPL